MLPQRGHFRRRRGGEAGRQGNLPPVPQTDVDEVILVNTDAICAAIKDMFEDTRSILEPAGALRSPG